MTEPTTYRVGQTGKMAGRFAPSPTGDLHLGNLRTAAVAWLAARSTGRSFIVRMEDLDRVQSRPEHEDSQLADLAAIGIDWDGDVVRQSERFDRYDDAIGRLADAGLVYECYCSRRDIRRDIEASASAPHGPPGSYPGTCRDLGDEQRRRRRRDTQREPALRLRTDGRRLEVDDEVAGPFVGAVDDVVLRRNDGVPAYNLAVVVDDGLQGVTQVVRGDDLLDSTPRQILLQQLLGVTTPTYLHVPLVVGADGERLSKRHGATTLGELSADGRSSRAATDEVVRWIGVSLGLTQDGERCSLADLVERFAPSTVPRSACPAPDFVAPRAQEHGEG